MADGGSGVMKCLVCSGTLERSGQEPQRLICCVCGQNFLAVLRLVPVEPLRRLELPVGPDAE